MKNTESLTNASDRSIYTGATPEQPSEVIPPGGTFIPKTREHFNELIRDGAGDWVLSSLSAKIECIGLITATIANIRLVSGEPITLDRRTYTVLVCRHMVRAADESTWSPDSPVPDTELRKFYDATEAPKESWVTRFQKRIGV